jgi:hypothetical protein
MHRYLGKHAHHPLNFGVRKQIDLGDSEDSSDSSDDDNDMIPTKSDPAKFLVGYVFASMLALEGADMIRSPCLRKGNAKRDRLGLSFGQKDLTILCSVVSSDYIGMTFSMCC